MTPLASLPIERRPRERLADPATVLPMEELVAVLIGKGCRGVDVMEVSRRICDRLLIGKTDMADLAAIPGVGTAKAAAVRAALQLPDSLRQRRNGLVLGDAQAVFRSCADLLVEPKEHLVVFYLTARSQQIARDTVSVGTATASLLHSREVFRPAILHNASHVVLAHNHPSGDPAPSQADLEGTVRMVQAGRTLGIEVLDHVVCASGGYVSLKAERPELFF